MPDPPLTAHTHTHTHTHTRLLPPPLPRLVLGHSSQHTPKDLWALWRQIQSDEHWLSTRLAYQVCDLVGHDERKVVPLAQKNPCREGALAGNAGAITLKANTRQNIFTFAVTCSKTFTKRKRKDKHKHMHMHKHKHKHKHKHMHKHQTQTHAQTHIYTYTHTQCETSHRGASMEKHDHRFARGVEGRGNSAREG